MADVKLDHALEVVRAIFSDTSVSQSETKGRLEAIREECGVLIDSIEETEGETDEGILAG